MRYFGIPVVIILLALSAGTAEAAPAGSAASVAGWRLVYNQRMVGMVQVDVCSLGVRFLTSFMNASVRAGEDKQGEVIIFNPDSKTYNKFTVEGFKKRAKRIYYKPADKAWKRVLMSVTDAETISGHPSKLYSYALRNLQRPNIQFLDKVWTARDMQTPVGAKDFLGFVLSTGDRAPGVPLKVVSTIHINPDTTEVVLEVKSIEKKQFKPSDFGPPPTYKLSTDDSNLIDFGMPLPH